MRLRLHLVVLLAASSLGAAPALAQPKPDASAPSKSEPAKPAPPTPAEIALRGQEMCERGDTQEAISALASALAQKASSEVATALAGCEAKVGRWAAAAEHYQAALRTTPEGPARKSLEERFAEARGHVGTVTITVNVEGADVFVGSRFVGQSPLGGEVFADPGRNLITVKKPNFDEAEQPVEVPARGAAALKIELVPGGRSANPYARSERTRVPFYVMGGLGLVAVGAGAALYAAALSKGAAADDVLAELATRYPNQTTVCRPVHEGCLTAYSLRSGHDTFANAGTGALIGGGVLIGVAVLYGAWAFAGSAPSSSSIGRITLAPVATPSGGGMWMTGTF
jgi:tetratricopeptide (TPR) repeat protein